MKKHTKIKERILQFADSQGIKRMDLYKKIDVDASNFSKKMSESEFSADKIVLILTIFPEINPEWLLLGEGEMLRKEPCEGSKISAVASAPQSNAAAGDIKIEAPTALLALLTQQQDTIARQASTIAHLSALLAQRSPQPDNE